MKFLRIIFFGVILLWMSACSKSSKLYIAYINGDVRVNGVAASTGEIDEEDISIYTGKNSSVIIQMGSKRVFALSQETDFRLTKGSFILLSGRIIAASDDKLFLSSKEVSIEAENSLFEIISKSSVSLINNYSGEVFVKSIMFEADAKGLILNENFSVEAVNGSFSPSQSLGTDIVRKNAPLKDLSAFEDRDRDDLIKKLSYDCISIINSSYGDDIERRFSLKTISSARGAISEVVTRSGKRIIGAVNVSGSKVTIYTVNGDVVMDVSQIKSMKRYSGE